jgi:hypothetical protein
MPYLPALPAHPAPYTILGHLGAPYASAPKLVGPATWAVT